MAFRFVVAWCVACVAAAMLGAAAPAHAGDAAQKLAMVDVSAVFKGYDKVPDVQRRINAKHQKTKDDLQALAKDLLARNKELETLYNQARTDEVIFDMVQKLRKDQFRYERALANLNAEIQKDYTRQMREVLSDIRVAVRTIAEKGGFDIVLRSPNIDEPETEQDTSTPDGKYTAEMLAPRTVAQVVERFNRNPVLYGAQTVDITAEVLQKLNDDFKKRTGTVK